jgi:sulfite reductase beta subunit-like hemoprotein
MDAETLNRRIDRCPGVLRLHSAQDGGLARVRLPGGMLHATQLRALGEAAEIGSDIVELTSRAGVQVRGIADSSAPALERVLTAGGLLPSRTHDRVRNVIASPVGGRHPNALGETDAVVRELDRLICGDPELIGLPGRFLFEVDDASGIGRAGPADVTLRALAPTDRTAERFRLVVGGIATDLVAAPAGAAALAVAAARAFLDLRDERGSDAWHLAGLENGPSEVARRLGGSLEPASPERVDRPPTHRASPAERRTAEVGLIRQRDGRHAVCGLAPLGRLDRHQLEGLADLSCGGPGSGSGLDSDPAGVRVSAWRTITLVDLAPEDSRHVLEALDSLGLVVVPGSPWVGLSACAGLGACASARIDVRGLAAGRALAGRAGETEHWSGCERRCGEPGDATIRVAPRGDQVAVWIDGTERLHETPAAALASLAAAGR